MLVAVSRHQGLVGDLVQANVTSVDQHWNAELTAKCYH